MMVPPQKNIFLLLYCIIFDNKFLLILRNSKLLSINFLCVTLSHMSIACRVVRPVSLQKIDAAPYAKRAAEAHNNGLQSINCTIEKFHKFTSINSDCDGVWVKKKPPFTAAASQSADGPELLAVPPFQHSQRKNFAPCFTQSAVYFPCKFFGFPVCGRGIMFRDPLAQHRSGNDCPVDFFLILEIIRKCPFVRVSHRSRSFLYGRFILRQNLHPTAQCRRGQRVRPLLPRAAFSGAGTTGSCPHQRCSFCQRPRGIYSGGGG